MSMSKREAFLISKLNVIQESRALKGSLITWRHDYAEGTKEYEALNDAYNLVTSARCKLAKAGLIT